MHKPVVRVLALATLPVLAGLLALPASGAPAADDTSLERAARVHGMTVAEVRSELRADPTLEVSSSGRMYYLEPTLATATEPQLAAAAPVALAQTFELHSNPGAATTIYLDFDGTDVSGTAWNTDTRVDLPDGFYAGWDADGGAGFGDAELRTIQEVWRRVAEDYAPFGVDVTTQDPGPEALLRSTVADGEYGARVLFSDSTTAQASICGGHCGGVAFLDSFDAAVGSFDVLEPSWVFPYDLGPDNASAMADAASHEVGHTLGLHHDGRGSDEYFDVTSLWGPIMGAPYGSGLTQWSQGSYVGATNTENDVMMIAGIVGGRTDEAPGGIAGAPLLGAGRGFIASRADRDTYALGDCTGTVTLTAAPTASGANLDIRLELLDATGSVVAWANPDAAYNGTFSASAAGLGASLTAELAAGADYVRVDGIGRGSWATTDHYDDYGSLGEYQLTRTGTCGEVVGDLPSAPQQVTATPDATLPQVTVAWQPPADAGSSAVTGYQVSHSGGAAVTLGADQLSHPFTDLAPSTTYTFSVAAVTATGTGPSATAQATTVDVPEVPPSAPQGFAATPDASYPDVVDLEWDPPTTPGTAPIIGYRLWVDGQLIADEADIPSDSGGGTVRGFDPATTYTFTLRAVSAVGPGASATTRATTAGAPAPARKATGTRIKAPKKVKRGTRPRVRVAVAVAGGGTATGSVRIKVGKKTVVRALRAGVASYKAPRQRRIGKVRVTASYLGTAAFEGSSATRKFRVRR